jgi:phage shock protein PspC (stress-responsive transcriptional regulator)
MEKKLYRSRTSKTIAGVCGGLGEYLNMDPTLVRVLWVLLSFWGPGLIAYIIMACIIPEAPEQPEAWQPPYQQPYQQPYQPPYQQPYAPPPPPQQQEWQAPPAPPEAPPADGSASE